MLLILILVCNTGHSQEDKVYKSISEALKSPAEVFNLELNGGIHADSIEYLVKLPQLKVLTIANSNEAIAPEYVSSLISLEELNYLNNNFYYFPETYKNLKNLRRLTLLYDTHLDLAQVMSVIEELPMLTELRIEGSRGEYIADDLKLPSTVEILSLRNNHLDHVPLFVKNLPKLKILDLGENDLTDVDSELLLPTKVSTIYLDKQPFLDFASAIDNLQVVESISTIHLEGNHLDASQLKNLGLPPSLNICFKKSDYEKSMLYKPNVVLNLPPIKHYPSPADASFKIPLRK